MNSEGGVHIYIYIYMYVYVYIYAYIYIHIYIDCTSSGHSEGVHCFGRHAADAQT